MKNYYAHNYIRAIKLLRERMSLVISSGLLNRPSPSLNVSPHMVTKSEARYIDELYCRVVVNKNRSLRIYDTDMKIMNDLWKRLKHVPMICDVSKIRRVTCSIPITDIASMASSIWHEIKKRK